MNEYVLVVVWLAFMGFLSMLLPVKKRATLGYDNDYEQNRFNLAFCIIVILPLIWVAANRTLEFGDTSSYASHYDSSPTSFPSIAELFRSERKDPGFTVFRILLKRILGGDHVRFFAVIATIQAFCVMLGYRSSSPSFMFSMLLFVLGCDYFTWMFNGIRQFLVAAIFFALSPLLLKKKYIPFLIAVLILSTVHQSCIIWIPFLFIAQGKPWNKKTILFLLAVVAAVVFLEEFTGLLGDYMDNSQYAYEKKDLMQDTGTGWPRILVFSVPALISFPFRKKIAEYDSPIVNVSVNMSIATMGLYVISGFTSGTYIGRLPIYFSLFNYILLPWEIDHLFPAGTKKLVLAACFLLYIGFFYVQMHLTWGLI